VYYSYFDKEKNRLKNYYKLLNIPRACDDRLVHDQYQKLHEEGKLTKSMEEAYAILSNPQERERYNRVFDRYNWDYGLQKNALYEKNRPKNRGRLLFLAVIIAILGFSTIAYLFLRAPQADAPSSEIQEPAASQEPVQSQPLVEEPSPVAEFESAEEEPTPAPEEAEAPAPFVSEEILSAYADFSSTEITPGVYPTARVTAGVNFRTGPSMESDILSALGTDESFLVLGKVGGWSYIYRESQGYGWIGGKYIQYTN
jgi:hypothetical protein